MRVHHLAAVVVLALSSVLLAGSCLQQGTTEPEASEPVGEDRERLPVVSYRPEDFAFRVVVGDDGKGKAGGWQAARADLEFWHVVIPHWPRHWRCAFTIEMPLRTEAAGPISSSEAAVFSVEIAEDVARAMNYDLPEGLFCLRFVGERRALFKSRYEKLGARVTR